MSIMREYDVRGIVGKELTNHTMSLLGTGFAELVKCRKDLHSPIVIGRDGRLTSEKFSEKFIESLARGGIDVIDIGLCTSPMVHFAIHHLKAGGSAIITASHNPKEYNGVKLNNNEGLNLSPKKEAISLAEFYEKNKNEKIEIQETTNQKEGNIIKKDILEDYISFLASHSKIKNPIKISADAGNGVGGISFIPLMEKLNISTHNLYMDVDGSFPNHESDPSKEETLYELQKKVRETKSDLGVAFDGDADRARFIDENGNIINSDIIACLIVDHLFEPNSQKGIVHEPLCTKAIADIAKIKNVDVTVTKVGRSHLANEMRANENNLLGVEISGHFFHKEFFGLDNAMLTVIKVANILSNSEKTLSELLKKYQTYVKTPILNIKVEKRNEAIEKIKKTFNHLKISELDGVTVESEDFKFTVRKSNTEPLIRIVAEAKTQEKLQEIKNKILETIE